MFKIQKRNPEEESSKVGLEPADVIKTLNCSTSAKMTLKRNPIRFIQSAQAAPTASTFLPHPLGKKNKSSDQPTDVSPMDDSSSMNNQPMMQMKERIYSISSNTVSPLPNKNVINFLASICVYVSLFMILHLAEAQFSSSSNNNGQYNNKQLPTDIRMMSFGNNNNQQAGMQSIVTPSSLQARSDSRYVSIDRFDSGEQIRPPLLGQPTTLAPSSKSQQVSAYQQGNFNLEASASDSYMTPEERDQLLRQQENHYEGRESADKSSNQQQGENSPKASYYKPSGSTKDGSSSVDAEEQQQQPIMDNRSLQSDATNNEAAAAADSDDSDYDQDEEPQQQHKKPVPSRAGSGKKQPANIRPETRRTMQANDNGDDAEPNEDFGGANDDAYFSRQPGAGGSGLNQAATQHQNRGSMQHNTRQPNYNSDLSQSQVNDQGKQGAVDEGQGFGPGPNEAYLADQADSSSSGKAGLDSEEDADGSSVNDMSDAGKLDRRSSSSDSKMNPATSDKTAAASPQQDSSSSTSFNGDDDDSDADEAADSSEDSFVPRVSSQEAAANSQQHQQHHQQTVPRESASAVTPSVATAASSIENVRSSTQPLKSTLPLFGIQRQPTANKQYMMQQPAAGSNPQPQSSIGTSKHQQKSALNAAYNPQNNPSHVGKFFIN